MSDRTMPHDLEAERAVLGAVMVNNDLLVEAMQVLRPRDFFRSAHGLIYETMLSLSQRQTPIDLLTIKDALGERLDAAGGPAYISQMTDGVPVYRNIGTYCNLVSKHAKARAIIQIANEVMARAYDKEDPDLLADNAGEMIFELGLQKSHGHLVHVRELLPGAMELLERQANSSERLLGLPTGFHNLDAMLGGLQPANLVIVAARPSMGKTALVMNIVQYLAVEHQKKSAVFSLEMSGQQLTLRMMQSGGQVDGKSMMRGTLTEVEWKRLSDAYVQISESPIHIDETSQMTLLEMRAKCRAMQRKHGLDLVAIDYLQLMPRAGEREMENRNLELAAISRGLKAMSKELNVPVVALAQISRKNEDRKDKRPMLSDLRDSGAIEQDADVVLFIHREEMYNAKEENRGIAEIIIGKQRNGPIGAVRLQWIQEHTRFMNITAGELY